MKSIWMWPLLGFSSQPKILFLSWGVGLLIGYLLVRRIFNVKSAFKWILPISLGYFLSLISIWILIMSTLFFRPYGPVNYQTKITNVALRPGTSEFAVAVHIHNFRLRGGDSPIKTLAEHDVISICDVNKRTCQLLGRLDPPKEVISMPLSGAKVGWENNAPILELVAQTGYSAADLLHTFYFIWNPANGFIPAADLPGRVLNPVGYSGFYQQPGPQITLNNDETDITVSLDNVKPARRAFTVDKKSGNIRPVIEWRWRKRNKSI
jgi:hypothetical protein